MVPPVFWRSPKRSSERLAAAAAILFTMFGMARAQLPAVTAESVSGDADQYAAAYACGEEPDGDRLKATVLLLLAGSGVEAATVGQARQQFIDRLRERMRSHAKVSAGDCKTVRGGLKNRLQALDTYRIEPSRR